MHTAPVMNIHYSDGSRQTTSNNRDDVVRCLTSHNHGRPITIYAGLVWDRDVALKYSSDPGLRAFAKLRNDEGTEAVDFE